MYNNVLVVKWHVRTPSTNSSPMPIVASRFNDPWPHLHVTKQDPAENVSHVPLLSALHLNFKRGSEVLPAFNSQSTFQQTSNGNNHQVIQWQHRATGNVPGKHMTVDQCSFEVDSAEHWLKGSSNRNSSTVL